MRRVVGGLAVGALSVGALSVLAPGGGSAASGPARSAVLAGGPTEVTMPVPAAVERAGGTRLAEFERGRVQVARFGCLACHRIGLNGNRGPGPNLTHVGAKLSRRRIERVMIHPPRPPMPSFRRAPRAKLRAIAEFLADLR